jgi:hypothetical protein
MFLTQFVEKIKTLILYSVILSFENFAVYEIRWKNIAEPERPQMTVQRIRISHWVHKATQTHTHTHTQNM